MLCYNQIAKEVYDSDGELVMVHPYITTPNQYGDHLVLKSRGAYMQHLASLWASESPSLSRIYLSIGYDEYWGMTSPFRIGCRSRILKLQDGTWHATDLDHWSEDSLAMLAKYYKPADNLPGILEDDIDLFADYNIYW